jgi:glycerol-3-phosphate O-acyltransferase
MPSFNTWRTHLWFFLISHCFYAIGLLPNKMWSGIDELLWMSGAGECEAESDF